MAQDIVITILMYFLIFIYQNGDSASAGPVRENVKKESLECRNCYERKFKREMEGFLARGAKSKKNLSDAGYTRTPRSYNYLLLKGWGAGGMPFNVLYTPNIYQKKILQSLQQKKPGKEARDMPEIYNLVLEDEKASLTERTPKKHSIPRKYYSLIPQLFVSYGW